VACDKQLVPGDEFALRPDGLFCKDCTVHSVAGSLGPLQLEENNNNNDQLEQDIDDQSQDGDKDLLLLDDRFADSGMQSYIFLSTLNTDLILWHPQWVLAAVKY
jgi:hypothetical protein